VRLLRPFPWLVLAVAACGGAPPPALGGFRLDMSQEQVVAEARRGGEGQCNLKGTRPRIATCEGIRAGAAFRVVVVDDTTAYIRVGMHAVGRGPAREMRRLTRRLGDPVWKERPYQAPLLPSTGFHTLWLNRDSTRSLALICEGRGLTPPCSAELARTSPPEVESRLDALLGIRR
jgi:hypothetical protein